MATENNMSTNDTLSFILIYAGTGMTWFLTIMDLIISIAVGLGTLLFTSVKLIESYKKFRAKIEIEKKAHDEYRAKKN